MPLNPARLKRRYTSEQEEPPWHTGQPLVAEQRSERKCRRIEAMTSYYYNGRPPRPASGIFPSRLAPKANVADAVVVSGSKAHPYCMGLYIKSDIKPCANNEGRAIFEFLGDAKHFLFYWGKLCKWIIGKDYQRDIGWLSSRHILSHCPSEVRGWRELQPISKEFDLVCTVKVHKVPKPPSPSAEKSPFSNNQRAAKPTAKAPQPPTPPQSGSSDDAMDDSAGIPVPGTPYPGLPLQPVPKWHPRTSKMWKKQKQRMLPAKREFEQNWEIVAKRECLEQFPTAPATPPPPPPPRAARAFWRERSLAPNELDLPMTRLCISGRCNCKSDVPDHMQSTTEDHDTEIEEKVATFDPYMSFEEADKSMVIADSFPSHGQSQAGKTIAKRVDELQRQLEQNASGGQVAKVAVSVSELEAKVEKKIQEEETEDIVDDVFYLAAVAKEVAEIQRLGTEDLTPEVTKLTCDELTSSSSTSSSSSSSESPLLRSKKMLLQPGIRQSRPSDTEVHAEMHAESDLVTDDEKTELSAVKKAVQIPEPQILSKILQSNDETSKDFSLQTANATTPLGVAVETKPKPKPSSSPRMKINNNMNKHSSKTLRVIIGSLDVLVEVKRRSCFKHALQTSDDLHFILTGDCDNESAYIKFRPDVRDFITELTKLYAVTLVTSAPSTLVDYVMHVIDPTGSVIVRRCTEGAVSRALVQDMAQAHPFAKTVVCDINYECWESALIGRRAAIHRAYPFRFLADMMRVSPSSFGDSPRRVPCDYDKYLACTLQLYREMHSQLIHSSKTAKEVFSSFKANLLRKAKIYVLNSDISTHIASYGGEQATSLTSGVHVVIRDRERNDPEETIAKELGLTMVTSRWLTLCFATFNVQDPKAFAIDSPYVRKDDMWQTYAAWREDDVCVRPQLSLEDNVAIRLELEAATRVDLAEKQLQQIIGCAHKSHCLMKVAYIVFCDLCGFHSQESSKLALPCHRFVRNCYDEKLRLLKRGCHPKTQIRLGVPVPARPAIFATRAQR